MAIKNQDVVALRKIDVEHYNFSFELNLGVYYYPIMLAAISDNTDCLRHILARTDTNLNVKEKSTGTNSFWLACFFGRLQSLKTFLTLMPSENAS